MHLTLILALFLQSPAVLQSMARGIPVVGKLTSGAGSIPLGVEVQLESEDGQLLDRRTVMPNGEFRFDGVALGRYWIVIEGERFENVRERLEIDIRTFAVANVTIALRPRAGLRQDGPQDAVVSADLLKRKVPREAMREYEKALDEKRKGQPARLIAGLEKAVRLYPDFYEAHYELGLAHQRAGNSAAAIASLTRASDLNTASVPVKVLLGRLMIEAGDLDKGADTLDAAIRLGAAPADAYFFLGAALYKLDELEDAETNLKKAVAMAPEHAGPAYLQLYNVYMKLRKGDLATAQLETYLEKFPESANAADIRVQLDRIRKATRR